MGLKIDIVANDGSPLGVTMRSLWGEDGRPGVGGAELGLLTLCEMWHNAGHRVRLYNDPKEANASPFEQLPKDAFDPSEKRDIVVAFRSPNHRIIPAKGMKVWLSTDQYTVGDFRHFSGFVDKIVCISPFHAKHFVDNYQITNTTVIDLPVRVQDIEKLEIVKIPNRLIFTSVPDRGLDFLRDAWTTIKARITDASLVITSDYRLWGLDAPMNEQHRRKWIGQEDVQFIGAIPRKYLLHELLSADIMPYPCTYDELFCIAVAEAQVCGVYPITSTIGALETTNMGALITGDPRDGRTGFMKSFCEEVIYLLENRDELVERQIEVSNKAIERFHPDNILKQWEEKVFNE